MLFVDTYKAFPTVWLDGLFHKLWEKGVRGKMFRVLYNLYLNASRRVLHEGSVSDTFICDLGLHEGDVISPTLYLYFIDDLLKEVHDKHPGITLLGPRAAPSVAVVAAMQADDFVAVCSSLAEVREVARTISEYSNRWRFRLNSAKSAVMHVAAEGSSTLSESGIVWNGVSVPVVSEYRYLGLWFHNSCTWESHMQEMVRKVQRVKDSLMPVWKSRYISVEVKRVVLLSCIRPIVEYGAEVWFPNSASSSTNNRWWDCIDRLQTDIIKCAMRCANEHPCTSAVLAEWGLKPMRMWLHERALRYYFKVHAMPSSRLPKQVMSAIWKPDRATNGGQRSVVVPAWQQHISRLLCRYGVDVSIAMAGKNECKRHIKQQLSEHYMDVLTKEISNHSTFKKYVECVHPKHLNKMSFKAPRPYLRVQCGCPTLGIEVLMRIRVGCLGVRAVTSKWGGRRANNNKSCPACGAETESISHLLLECPAYCTARNVMFDSIKAVPGCAEKLQTCLTAADHDYKALRFVSCDYWGSIANTFVVSRAIANYLRKAWMLRNSYLHANSDSALRERGADGNVAMA